MEFTGKIICVLPLETGTSQSTGNTWAVQGYVIEQQNVQYPKKMCFQIFGQDKINEADIIVGEALKVQFEIDANQWQDKWYNKISAWKVERIGGSQPIQQQTRSETQTQQIFPPENNNEEGELPF